MTDINVTIADANPIDVTIDSGLQGPQGDPGEGVPVGGTTSQLLAKASGTDYDTEWVDVDGDVVGPSSAVDNAISTFNTTTGKLIQDSGLISVDDKIYQSGFPNTYIKFNDGQIEIWVGGNIQARWS